MRPARLAPGARTEIDPFRTVAQLACERDGDLPVWIRAPKSGQGALLRALLRLLTTNDLTSASALLVGRVVQLVIGGWILDMRIASGQICDMTGTRIARASALSSLALFVTALSLVLHVRFGIAGRATRGGR